MWKVKCFWSLPFFQLPRVKMQLDHYYITSYSLTQNLIKFKSQITNKNECFIICTSSLESPNADSFGNKTGVFFLDWCVINPYLYNEKITVYYKLIMNYYAQTPEQFISHCVTTWHFCLIKTFTWLETNTGDHKPQASNSRIDRPTFFQASKLVTWIEKSSNFFVFAISDNFPYHATTFSLILLKLR